VSKKLIKNSQPFGLEMSENRSWWRGISFWLTLYIHLHIRLANMYIGAIMMQYVFIWLVTWPTFSQWELSMSDDDITYLLSAVESFGQSNVQVAVSFLRYQILTETPAMSDIFRLTHFNLHAGFKQ